MGTAISCTICSQVAGLIRKVSRSSSEASSLRATAFHAAVFRAAVLGATAFRAAVFCSKNMAIVIVTCY